MQPGEEIENLVDELEGIVSDGKKPLMGGGQGDMRIVDANDVYELLDEIRRVFPEEFQSARRIVKEEDEILARAHQTADSIVADAQQQAMILAGDQEVVRLAIEDNLKSVISQLERSRQALDDGSNNRR